VTARWFVVLLAGAAAAPAPPGPGPRIVLQDVARESGIDFVLENSPTPRKHLIETMPGGVACSTTTGTAGPTSSPTGLGPRPEKESPRHWNHLFRNEGRLRFADVTDAAGLRGAGYSMAVAVADYDNDGDPDLFVGGVHRQALYRNAGGRFEDVAARAGVASAEWVVGAGWLDYDNDGWLDLMVVNYTVWTPDFDRFCGDSGRSIRVYCHPKWFPPVSLSLFRNRGDGTFEDVSVRSGLARVKGRGMAVAFADYDQDGWPDAYVTNDKLPSFLFHNRRDGTFEEVGLPGPPPRARPGDPAMGASSDRCDDGRPDPRHRPGRGGLPALPQPRRGTVPGRDAPGAAGPARRRPQRLEQRPRRPRQRRREGPVHGQRPRQRRDRALREERLPADGQRLPERGRRDLHRRLRGGRPRRGPAPCPPRRGVRGLRRRPRGRSSARPAPAELWWNRLRPRPLAAGSSA
jgi:hypothetical protein